MGNRDASVPGHPQRYLDRFPQNVGSGLYLKGAPFHQSNVENAIIVFHAGNGVIDKTPRCAVDLVKKGHVSRRSNLMVGYRAAVYRQTATAAGGIESENDGVVLSLRFQIVDPGREIFFRLQASNGYGVDCLVSKGDEDRKYGPLRIGSYNCVEVPSRLQRGVQVGLDAAVNLGNKLRIGKRACGYLPVVAVYAVSTFLKICRVLPCETHLRVSDRYPESRYKGCKDVLPLVSGWTVLTGQSRHEDRARCNKQPERPHISFYPHHTSPRYSNRHVGWLSIGITQYYMRMNFSWDLFIDLGLLSAGLLVATGVRFRFRFFQRYLIPNALTAGFILLPVYNYIMPHLGLNADNLGRMVYHLLSLSFISMTLRRGEPKTEEERRAGRHRIVSTSVATLFPWGIQAIVGLVFTVFLMRTVMPDLFPAFGMLLPLGFAQGPGQAFAIGEGWVRFGFHGAGSIGLTFAATGFLFSSFGGVFLINLGIRRRWLDDHFIAQIDTSAVKSGIYPSRKRRPVAAEMTTESEAIDSFSLHVGMVLAVYLLAYLLLLAITELLTLIGPLGADLAVNLWGISFIFSALTAIVVRGIMSSTGLDFVVDNKTLTRISGLSVDLMVVSAIAAISLVVVQAYLIPIILLSLIAGTITLAVVPWFCSRIFVDHRFHRALLIFGVSTGTLPTGLALLRAIDPEFETPVARDYMFASGLTFVFAIPFILAINLPAYAATTGNMMFLWAAVGVGAAYTVIVLIAFLFIAGRRAVAWRKRLWMPAVERHRTGFNGSTVSS